jgi:uncharacterized protein
VIAVDTNILVHAHQRQADLHERARAVIKELAEGPVPWAICFHALIEFYGVVTSERIWRVPSTPAQALDQIAAWRESPTLRLLADDASTLPLLADLLTAGQVRGGRVHDARIASCCLAHGVHTLLTVDRDFSRFTGLRTRNPLVG